VLTALPGLKIASARQTLTISTADVETSGLLRIPVNAPVAEVRRVMRGEEGTVIYLAEVTDRGDYIHLDMDLKP
jgi:GntR family transcriptional regulator